MARNGINIASPLRDPSVIPRGGSTLAHPAPIGPGPRRGCGPREGNGPRTHGMTKIRRKE